MSWPPGHSLAAFNKQERANGGKAIVQAQIILLKSLLPPVDLALFIGQLAFSRKMLAEFPCLSQCRGKTTAAVNQALYDELKKSTSTVLLKSMVGRAGRACIYKGTDVRLLTGDSYNPIRHIRQAFDADMLAWKSVLAVPLRRDHINVQELRGFLLAMRWRSRRTNFINSRFLHILDSQVSIGVVAKARSSSRKLQLVLRRIASLMLAADATGYLPYVESGKNPADKASRWYERK